MHPAAPLPARHPPPRPSKQHRDDDCGDTREQATYYEQAANEFSAALNVYGNRYARDRAYTWDQLAHTHLARGDLDQAVHAGNQAVELLTTQVNSPRTGQQVRALTMRFAQVDDHPTVADFLERARTVVATPA